MNTHHTRIAEFSWPTHLRNGLSEYQCIQTMEPTTRKLVVKSLGSQVELEEAKRKR